jgi:phage protein D
MPTEQHTYKFRIEVDGAALPQPVDRNLVSAFVDDNLNLPDMFQLVFRDPERTVLEQGKFKIGAKVTISVVSEDTPGGEKLLTGDVTALEAEYDSAGTMTVVRGFDTSHRLFRGRVTESYTNTTYADVAKKVAVRAGLALGKVDAATTVHPHVVQGNVNDWDFLKSLAGQIGYEMGCLDGKFEFRAPGNASEGPETGTLDSDDPLQLTLGSNLLHVRSIVTAAEQVKQVQVRGWDMREKKTLVGTAPAETRHATIGVEPAKLAQDLGSPDYVSVDTPYGTQAEVDAAAKSIAGQIAGAFAELEGVARGNPKLRAGKAVSLGLVKAPFDGKYVLTTTRHVYESKEGYTVWFTVSGRQERSLYGLASGGSNGGGASAGRPIYGVVPALVTDVNDPENLGRVKLKFPWLSDDYTSDWARTLQLSAGPDRGTVFLPEVNDEVLVAFEQGDLRRPFLLGGLYNGVAKPKLGDGLVDSTGAVKRRGFISKKGHKVVFLDDDSKSGVMLSTADNGLRIALKETGTTIRINSKGKVEIEAQGDVTIKAQGQMQLEAQGQMELKAGAGLKIDGGPQVEIKGGIVKLN